MKRAGSDHDFAHLILTPLLAMLAVASILSVCANAQGTYTVTQVTKDAANHEWPSINDNGEMVWAEERAGSCSCSAGWSGYSCGKGMCWQVFKYSKGSKTQVTSDTHNHVFPQIDNAGDIMYLKDEVGGGPGLNVVLLKSGVENVFEFSSGNPPGCTEPPLGPSTCNSWRAAGLHFGIGDGNGQTVSYFDFCSPSCSRTFDVSNRGQFNGLPSTADYPDMNAKGDLAYFDGAGSVFKTNVVTPHSVKVTGNASLPRINDARDVVVVSGGQVVTFFSPNYTLSTVVNQTGLWADIDNNGVVVFEDVDTNGHHQIFEAKPDCVTAYDVPGRVLDLHQTPNTCWATAATILVSWKRNQQLTEDQVTAMADSVPPPTKKYQQQYDAGKGLTLIPTNDFLKRLALGNGLTKRPTVCEINKRLHTYGLTWVVTGTTGAPPTAHAEVVVGIHGDGTETGTFLKVIDPDDGTTHDISFQTLMVEIAPVNNWPEWFHF
jgi:hypothetical protein